MQLRMRINRLLPGEAPGQYSGPIWAAVVFAVTGVLGLVGAFALVPLGMFRNVTVENNAVAVAEAVFFLAVIVFALIRQIRLKQWACLVTTFGAWWVSWVLFRDVVQFGWASPWMAVRDIAMMAVAPLMTVALVAAWDGLEEGV